MPGVDDDDRRPVGRSVTWSAVARTRSRWPTAGDDGQPGGCSAGDVTRYAEWVAELAGLLPLAPRWRTWAVARAYRPPASSPIRGLRVIGVDFSAVQLARARRLVPAFGLVQADMADGGCGEKRLEPAERTAIVPQPSAA